MVAHAPLFALLALYWASTWIVLPAGAIPQSYKVDGAIRGVLDTSLKLLVVAPATLVLVLLFTRARMQTIRSALGWLRKQDWAEILLCRVVLAYFFTTLFANFYVEYKINIPVLTSYTWDHVFAAADWMLFLGHDPWRLTHALLPGPEYTGLIDTLYIAWFPILQITGLVIALLPLRNHLRLTYLMTFALTAILSGNLLAILMPAVGPCYMEPLTGDGMFRPLMDLLAQQNQHQHLQAVTLHARGWAGMTDPGKTPLGISAFPSLHVQMAAVFAITAFQANRILGWVLTGFAAVMFIGSVHLAWHYAVDGIAGILLALLYWRISARFSAWWLALTDPAARPLPSLEPVPVPVAAEDGPA